MRIGRLELRSPLARGEQGLRVQAPLSWTERDARPMTAVGPGSGGWRVMEPYAGAWQQNVEWSMDTVLSFHAVFSCVTLIAADIGKLRLKLQRFTDDGIWIDAVSPAFSPVLKKPNRYQNHIQFKEWWMASKLMRGNAYALKERDQRGVVVALYLLDAARVTPLVADDGAVYYQLGPDNLAGVPTAQNVTVPASEIIHDRMNCLFHPLVGLSPIFACGLAAAQGLEIQKNQAGFFKNSSMPGGVLTAPRHISDDTAARLKAAWEEGYTGRNAGRVAVLGDGLEFVPMRMTAVDSQLIEQLGMTEKIVCSAFHVPGFMVGIGAEPTFSNSETRTGHYYSQCLQSHIEAMEACLDEGLGLDDPKPQQSGVAPIQYGVTLDLDALLRMDQGSLITSLKTGVDGAIYTPNEARKKAGLPPIAGGDTVYMQQQEFSLEALAKRDQRDDPFETAAKTRGDTPPAAAAAPTPPADDGAAADDGEADDQAAEKTARIVRSIILEERQRMQADAERELADVWSGLIERVTSLEVAVDG